jgi:hypothetical protein
LTAILALPPNRACNCIAGVTEALAWLLALLDRLHVCILVKNIVALDAILALPDCCEEAVFSAPPVTVANAALLAFADICDVASTITSFVTLSASDALLLTLATGNAVLEASAADDALLDSLEVAVLLPAVAPCAAIRALDCICDETSLVTLASAALLAFDANRALTVTVLVANAALLALPAI